MLYAKRTEKAFTLIELLVVIAILAILFIVVLLVLNPAQLLAQSRDADRIQDLATVSAALGYYVEDTASNGTATSLGNASTSYISVPDASATSTAGDQCQGLNMPSLGSSTFQCAANSSYRGTGGTGWIPVAFSSISVGSPLGQLPQDPTNQTSTGLFYSYSTDGTHYEVTAVMESAKYKQQLAANPQVPDYPEVAANGSSLSISPLYSQSGLVGWWPLTEGSGTIAYDQSGSGNNGTWSGTPVGGSYYTGGKVGNYSGNFDGSTDYVDAGTGSAIHPTSSLTVATWANLKSTASVIRIISTTSGNNGWAMSPAAGVSRFFLGNGSGLYVTSGPTLNANAWYFMVGTWNGSVVNFYVNGTLVATSSFTGLQYASGASNDLRIGNEAAGDDFTSGLIGDVRIYNRALSATEIAAIYNAEK